MLSAQCILTLQTNQREVVRMKLQDKRTGIVYDATVSKAGLTSIIDEEGRVRTLSSSTVQRYYTEVEEGAVEIPEEEDVVIGDTVVMTVVRKKKETATTAAKAVNVTASVPEEKPQAQEKPKKKVVKKTEEKKTEEKQVEKKETAPVAAKKEVKEVKKEVKEDKKKKEANTLAPVAKPIGSTVELTRGGNLKLSALFALSNSSYRIHVGWHENVVTWVHICDQDHDIYYDTKPVNSVKNALEHFPEVLSDQEKKQIARNIAQWKSDFNARRNAIHASLHEQRMAREQRLEEEKKVKESV